MCAGTEALTQTVERECIAAQMWLKDLRDREQQLQVQQQACMRAEAAMRSRQEVLNREEEDVALYACEVMCSLASTIARSRQSR
jgi:ribosome-associated translation inhibitor RaiA